MFIKLLVNGKQVSRESMPIDGDGVPGMPEDVRALLCVPVPAWTGQKFPLEKLCRVEVAKVLPPSISELHAGAFLGAMLAVLALDRRNLQLGGEHVLIA